MRLTREDVPHRIVDLLGRPARWAPRERVVGDYDGRDRTLEVFLADAGDQRALLRALRADRPELESAAGGAIIVVFHTRVETERLYPDIAGRDVLRRLRAVAPGRAWAVQAEPIPLDEAASVHLTHGALEAVLSGCT